jgi:SAM-dependent methyltransferase
MDLSERTEQGTRRHPWESARVQAVEQIVRDLAVPAPRVLDVGSGDGYLLHRLHTAFRFQRAVGVDIHLSESLAQELSSAGVELQRELTDPAFRAELILLLDVLEHVEDPVAMLTQLARERLASGGRFVITVPAFQPLYTDHDRALKHYRRYSRPELIELVQRSGLAVIDSGYLFASLLLPRAASALRERWLPKNGAATHGVGAWQGGSLLTQLLHGALVLDNRLCLAAREWGVRVPGLTVWLTCKTPS